MPHTEGFVAAPVAAAVPRTPAVTGVLELLGFLRDPEFARRRSGGEADA
jgi:hypothetical protein